MADEITRVAVVPLKRQYPHVDSIADFSSQQSIKLLWDRIFTLQEQLTAAQATIGLVVDQTNVNSTDVSTAILKANQALAERQVAAAQEDTDAVAPPEPGSPLPGGGDGGAVQEGINAGIPSGHDTGGVLSGVRAGQIIGGTATEWAALCIVTPDVPTRQANAEALLLRIIWHLHQAGFVAGRQRNPSGLISPDKMCVEVDGVIRAYDIFISYDNNTIPLQVAGNEVAPAQLVDDPGLPD